MWRQNQASRTNFTRVALETGRTFAVVGADEVEARASVLAGPVFEALVPVVLTPVAGPARLTHAHVHTRAWHRLLAVAAVQTLDTQARLVV